jgi:GNAT superfamily N-acetyltransferase
MPSLYAQYVKEKRGLETLEHDWGFVTYEIKDEVIYLADIFVLRESRHQGKAAQLCQELGEIAKTSGCKRAFGSVDPSAKNSTEGVKLILALGMELVSIENGLIFFAKEI